MYADRTEVNQYFLNLSLISEKTLSLQAFPRENLKSRPEGDRPLVEKRNK